MSAPKPKPGERWRVTIEGEIRMAFEEGKGALIGALWQPFAVGTWERLPDPEPEWQPGDLVLDARGEVWRRREPVDMYGVAYVWDSFSNEYPSPDATPVRPLRRLVVAE